ncbi:MAG: hypothetical protein R2746_03995 [Acidimicrobiales bacterium]
MSEPTAPVATVDRSPSLPATVMAPPPLRGSWPPGARLVRATAIVGFVAVLVALVGLALGLRPLSTPTQDCGTAASFLLRGKVNVFVDPSNPPEGITRAEAEANNAEPCQERAANRAKPAGALVVGGTFVGLVALLVEWVARFRLHRAANRRLGAPAPSPGADASA